MLDEKNNLEIIQHPGAIELLAINVENKNNLISRKIKNKKIDDFE